MFVGFPEVISQFIPMVDGAAGKTFLLLRGLLFKTLYSA